MADDLQRLIVSLEAQTKQFNNALAKANGEATRRARQIESRFAKMNSGISAQFGKLAAQMAGAFAAQVSLRGAQGLIDAATRIDNALKVAGLSGEELERVYERLYDSAKKSAAPLEALVELYGRASLVQKELGVTTADLLNFTDKVAVALRVSGKSAQESSGALLQLSQALGSGVVRAEEFNSILEGALPIAQAAAAGLKEAGGSVAKLRQLVVEGKVSSEAFFRAFEAGSVILEQKVAGAALTSSGALENLHTELVNAARKFDDVADVSGATVTALDKLAGIVRGLSNVFEAAANGPIGTFIGQLEKIAALIAQIEPLSKGLGIILNEDTLNGIAGALNPATGPTDVRIAGGKDGRVGVDPIQSRIDQAFGTGGDVKPVWLTDFKLPSSKKNGRSKIDSYQRELEQIKERTASLQAETAAQKGLCGTIFFLEDFV